METIFPMVFIVKLWRILIQENNVGDMWNCFQLEPSVLGMLNSALILAIACMEQELKQMHRKFFTKLKMLMKIEEIFSAS